MANNRMVLVCNICIPKKGKWTWEDRDKGKILVLAKWYPAGGFKSGENGAYYRNDNGEFLGKELLEFLDKHQHLEKPSKNYTKGAGQEYPVRLEYEC